MNLPINQIICGDVIEILKTFPNESIDCCITSPPYWGLRDYQTAKWVGGSENCEHIEKDNKHCGQRADRNQDGYKKLFVDICAKCGAKRIDNQIGLEKTPEEYVAKMVEVFSEVKRCLKKEGTLWLNLGDSYGGSGMGLSYSGFTKGPNAIDTRPMEMRPATGHQRGKWNKQLMGIPWRVAFALQSDDWYLRQDIIWHKPNPMPESVKDRCTKAHEYIFLLAKSQKYYFDGDAILEPLACPERLDRRYADPDSLKKTGCGSSKINEKTIAKSFEQIKERGGRNKRSVWTVTTKPFKGAHFATFPEDLIVPMVNAGCPKDGIVLDPFMGAGTTAVVARKLSRQWVGIELNPKYIEIANKRMAQEVLF